MSKVIFMSLLYAVQALHFKDVEEDVAPDLNWSLCTATRGHLASPNLTYTGVGKDPAGNEMDMIVTANTAAFGKFTQEKHECWGQFEPNKQMAKQGTPALEIEFAFVKTGTYDKIGKTDVFFTVADIDAGWKVQFGNADNFFLGQSTNIDVNTNDTSNMIASSQKNAKFSNKGRPDDMPFKDQKGAITVHYRNVNTFKLTVSQELGKFKSGLNFKFGPKTSFLPPEALLTCENQIDMFLALDASGSVDQTGWDQSKNAAVNIVRAVKPTAAGSHIELSWYSTTVNVFHKLDGNETAMTSILGNTPLPGGNTYINLALDEAKKGVKAINRSKPIVMLMTDGEASDRELAFAAADDLKKFARLIVVAIGSNVPMKDVKKLASNSSDIIPVTSFTVLDTPGIINEIIDTTCSEVKAGGNYSRSR